MKVLHEMQWPESVLVAEYACPADQIETRGMVSLFKKWIPPNDIQWIKARLPEVSSVFEETPCAEEHLFPGSTPLRNTLVRNLIALAGVYFRYRNSVYLNSLNFSAVPAEENREYYDFLGRIPGVTIVERCYPDTDLRECYTVTFGHCDWYATISPAHALLVEPKRVLDFLQSKGYTKSQSPSIGQVVVYHTATKTNHFAKVLEVEPDGRVMAISKFGPFHIYTHPVELAQFHYGNSVTFLNPPK